MIDNLEAKSYQELLDLRTSLADQLRRLCAELSANPDKDARGHKLKGDAFTRWKSWRDLIIQDKTAVESKLSQVKQALRKREHEAEPQYTWIDRPAPRSLGPRELKAMAQCQQSIVNSLKETFQREKNYLAALLREVDRQGLPEREPHVDAGDNRAMITLLEDRGYVVTRAGVASDVELEEVALHFNGGAA